MNTLIAYGTKHGCTEKCAHILSGKLSGSVELVNLKVSKALELSQYDRVIIGGSIHIGKIQKEVNQFCSRYSQELVSKQLGLYVCGMFFEKAEEELISSFPHQFLTQAQAKEFFGGEFQFRKMNPLEKLIVKKVSKVDKDVSSLLEENINRFVQSLNNKCDRLLDDRG